MQKINQIQVTHSAQNTGQQVRRQIQDEGAEGFAKMLESVVLKQMFSQMNSAMLSGGLFGKSHQGKIFEGMFTESIAQEMANAGGIGIAPVISQQFEGTTGDAGSTDWTLTRTRKLSMFDEAMKNKLKTGSNSQEGDN